MSDLILADFNLAVGWSICQTAKFNSPPNFPAIWYGAHIGWALVVISTENSDSCVGDNASSLLAHHVKLSVYVQLSYPSLTKKSKFDLC